MSILKSNAKKFILMDLMNFIQKPALQFLRYTRKYTKILLDLKCIKINRICRVVFSHQESESLHDKARLCQVFVFYLLGFTTAQGGRMIAAITAGIHDVMLE